MPLNWLWGYLLLVGTLLLAWGGLPPHKARQITPLAALALALAIVGYWAVGFAFHLGGAHAVNPDDPALYGLDRLLAPAGAGWGWMGLAGFFLAGQEVTPTVLALFLAYVPLIASAVLWVVLALADLRRWVVVVAGTLTGAIIVPLAACWAWGSGWLSHLGETLRLGLGFVDFGGGALVLWLPGMITLGILLLQPRREVEEPLPPPPAYFPLLANLGVLLMGIGWSGWALSDPFHTAAATWDWNRASVSVLLGMAGAVLTSQLYAWLVTGEIDPLLSARGLAAGWSVVLAGAPFFPPWAALIIGALTGLLFPFISYTIEARLRLQDSATTVALGVTGGLIGTLSIAVFADGTWGQGWNRMDTVYGGVTGLLARGGFGQLQAQLVGLLALGLWGLGWGVLLGFIANPRIPWQKTNSDDGVLLEETHQSSEEEAMTSEDEQETGHDDGPEPADVI
ncbi:MAG: hypothetical protein JXA33_21830 [Anaerolineae bacterium]|nr:hypothetical protein [Anaerolineae bacterium]